MADRPGARRNRLIEYHAPIAKALTDERTSLESRLIPVTAYIVVACAEAFMRYPDLMARIEAAMPAEEIGRRGRRPGSQVNTVFLWSIANFWLLGRKIVGTIDPARDDPGAAPRSSASGTGPPPASGATTPARPGTRARRRPTTRTSSTRCWPASNRSTTTPGPQIKRFNATLIAYLFLMYFDTRVGSGDTGPYRLDDGRVLLVRDYYRLGQSDFWWSSVAKDVPYQHLTAALVLDGVDFTITDFGTAKTDPEDYLDHLVGFGLFTTDTPDRSLAPVGLDQLDPIMAAVRTAQSAHYRAIAAMDRDEKIRCGAYVYFSFLKQFADEAGVGDELDWSVPRDLPPEWYAFFSAMEGTNDGVDEEGPYYAPYGSPS